MTFCDINNNIIYWATIFTLDVYLPDHYYALLTVDKNEQTLVERPNKLFAGYYHADCTAKHKYVPDRCLFYIYRYHGPQ